MTYPAPMSDHTDAPGVDPADPEATISQVLALLFGEAQQSTTNRINHLDDLLREMERAARERMDGIERRIEEERARVEEQRRRDFTVFAEAIEDLSRDVRRLAES